MAARLLAHWGRKGLTFMQQYHLPLLAFWHSAQQIKRRDNLSQHLAEETEKKHKRLK
jgi:hypothetical protein